ncbi:hypothetical protein KW786_02365 [Candidatus Parcubacteria bacterium]|nr:hypothetical protein [Candidatus Parcubacteria bacterium]
MAIVFVSARNKQNAFFWGIAVLLVLFLGMISLIVFLPEFLNMPSEVPPSMTYQSPNTNVDLRILNSDTLTNLEPFNVMEATFSYTVTNAAGKKTTGTISAASREEAQSRLEGSGFKVESLEETKVGRANPFVSY